MNGQSNADLIVHTTLEPKVQEGARGWRSPA